MTQCDSNRTIDVCVCMCVSLFMYRYHLGGNNTFSEEAIRFICAEIGCALDFLHGKRIIHRDVKPDNILLDDKGHAHLTDFNVATKINSNNGMILLIKYDHCS